MTTQVNQLNPQPAGRFLSQVVRSSWIVLLLVAFIQIIFFWDITNTVGIGAVILAWWISTRLFFNSELLINFPFSTFSLIGFAGTQFYFPLLFTTLEGKPLIYNLELPEQVFFHSLAALMVLILAHAFYRLLSRLTYNKSFSLLGKAGFFDAPSELQLWLMGLMGMGSAIYVYFLSPDLGREVTGSASDKFLQGLVPFSYAPYFIPFGKMYGGKEVNIKRLLPLLGLFTVLLFGISMGRNSRGAFMMGFTAVGFSYILGMLLGVFKSDLFTKKNVLIAAAFIWLLTGPVADLGTAMVIAREHRETASPLEMIDLTLETYGDKDAITTRRTDDQGEVFEDWDERYLDNIFTTRFANLKYNDVSLMHAAIVREYDPDMLNFSIDYILGTLPDPFLKILGIDVDKEFVYSLSIGDYLYVATGGNGPVTGFRAGHFAGTGLTAFGWWYLFLLGIVMIPAFYLMDKFLRKKDIPASTPNNPSQQTLQISFCGMLSISTVFHFLPQESIVMVVQFLIRGWIQIVILYFFFFHITRIIANIFKGSRSLRFKHA